MKPNIQSNQYINLRVKLEHSPTFYSSVKSTNLHHLSEEKKSTFFSDKYFKRKGEMNKEYIKNVTP